MSKRNERQLRDRASFTALKRMLKEICDDPKSHIGDESLGAALASQGALAAYENVTRSITRMSLNHLKAVANTATAHDDEAGTELPGFTKLDNLRKQAASALQQAATPTDHAPKRTSKAGLAARMGELEALVLELREDAFLLQAAYDLRCRQARSYAEKAGAATVELCNREQREIDLTFSLTHRSFAESKIASLQGARYARQTK